MNSNILIARNSSSSNTYSHAGFSSTLASSSAHKKKAEDEQLNVDLQSAVSNGQSKRGEDTMNSVPSWFFELSQENELLKQRNKDLVQEKIEQEGEVTKTEVKVSELLNQLGNAEMMLEKEKETCKKYEREKSMLEVQVEKLMMELYHHGHKKSKAYKDGHVELNNELVQLKSKEKSRRILLACRSQVAAKSKSIRKMEDHIKKIWKILVEFGNALASSELLAAQQKCDLLKICEEYHSFNFLSSESRTDIFNSLNALSTTSELRRVSTDFPKANTENEDEVFAVENSPSIFITPNHKTLSEGNSSLKMLDSSQNIPIEFNKNQDEDENSALHGIGNSGQKEPSFANIQMSFSIAPFLELGSPTEVSKCQKNNEPSKSDHSPCRDIEFEYSPQLPSSANNSFSETIKTFLHDLNDESNHLFNESDSGQVAEVPIGDPVPKIVENSVHSVKKILMEDLYLSEDSFDNPGDVNTLNHHGPMENELSIENSSLAFDQSNTKCKDVVSSDFSNLAKGNKLIQDSGDLSFTLMEEYKLKQNSDDCTALMDENEIKHNSKYLSSNLVKGSGFGQASDDLSTCLLIESELVITPDVLHSTVVIENELTQEKELSSAKVNETESIENIDDLPSTLVKETQDNEDLQSAYVREKESIQKKDDSTAAKENELTQEKDLSSAKVYETESIVENIDDLPSALVKENESTRDNEDLPFGFAKEKQSIENMDDLPKTLEKENELVHDNEDPPSAFVKENESIENTGDLPKASMEENELTQDNDDLPSALVKENKSKQTYDDLLFTLMKESNSEQNSIVFPSTTDKENKLIENAYEESALLVPIATISPTSTPLREYESLNSITHASTDKTCVDNRMSIIDKTGPFIGISNVQCDNEDSHESPTFSIHSSTPLRGYVNFSHSDGLTISTGNLDPVQKSLNKGIAVVNTENTASSGSETSSIVHNVLGDSIHKSSKDCISDKVFDTAVDDENKLKTFRNKVENCNNFSDSDDKLNKSQNELCTVSARKCDDGSVKLGFNLIKSCTITLDPNNYNVSCVFTEPEDASRTSSSYKEHFSPTLLSNNSSTIDSRNFDDNQFPNTKTQKISSPISLQGGIENSDSNFPMSQNVADRELTPQQCDSIASSSNAHNNIPDFLEERSSEPIEYLSESSFDSSVVPSDSDSSFTVETKKSNSKRKPNLKRRSKFSQRKTNRKQVPKKALSKKGKQPGKISKSNGTSIIDDISLEIVEDALQAAKECRLKILSEGAENDNTHELKQVTKKALSKKGKQPGTISKSNGANIIDDISLEIVEDTLKAAEECRHKILSEGAENDKTHELNFVDNISSKTNSCLKSTSNRSISQRIKSLKSSKIDSESQKRFPMRQMVAVRQIGTSPSNPEKVPSEDNLTFQKQVAYEQEPQNIDDSDFSFSEDEPKTNDAPMSSNNASFSFEERFKKDSNDLDEQINTTDCDFEITELNTGKRRFEDPTVVKDPFALFGSSLLDENNTSHSFENDEPELVISNQNESSHVSTSIADQHKKDFEIVNDDCSENSKDSSPLKPSTQHPDESMDHVSPTPQTFDNLMLKLFKEFSENVKNNKISPKNRHASVIDQIKSDFGIIGDNNSSQGNEYSSPLKDTNAEFAAILADTVLSTSEHMKGNQSAPKIASDMIVDEIETDVINEDNCSQISENSSSSIVECQNKLEFTDSPTSHTVLAEGNHHAYKTMSVSTKCQTKSDFNIVEDSCSQSSEDSCLSDTNHEYLDELTDPVSPILHIPNNKNNKNLTLKGVLNKCDVGIHEDYTKPACSRGVEKVHDALEDSVVIPETFEDILIKHMKENKIVEKQPKPSNFIELIKNNSHVSFEDILNAHLEDVKVLEGNQNSSNVSELEKSNATPIANSFTLGQDADLQVSDTDDANSQISDTDNVNSQVSELDLFIDENNSVSSDSEDKTKCEDFRISSNEQLNTAVTTQVDFGVLSSDNIISQFSSQGSELMECNKNLHGSLVGESDAKDYQLESVEREVKTVEVAITSGPSSVQVGGGRVFRTKDSVAKCVDKVNSVHNCESSENEAVEEDLIEGETIAVLEKNITKHEDKQKINTIKNYFSKSVCVDATAEVLPKNKNLHYDKVNINDNNGGNFSVKSYSKNNVGNLSEYQTVNAESDQNVFNATEIANSSRNRISHKIKECFVLLKTNEALSKDIGSDISKDNGDVSGLDKNKSCLEKSNKYKEKLPVHKCGFSVNSIETPSRYANLVGKNIESFKGIKNKASVLEMAKNILATSIKRSSCIDKPGISTNIKPNLYESVSDSDHEEELLIDKNISTEQYDIFGLEDELHKKDVNVNSKLSMQQCHVAPDPVVISPSIENATEKVHESLTVQKKSTFVDENKLCLLNREKLPSNQGYRTSPRKQIPSTHDANSLADIKQVLDISKDVPTKTQNRTHGKRKVEEMEKTDFKAKKKFKLRECFVLLEPISLPSQWEEDNSASGFSIATKESAEKNLKMSHSKMNIDTSDNDEVVDGKVRKTRNLTKKLDGHTKGQNADGVIKTNVSSSSSNLSDINQDSISIESEEKRTNVFFLNQTSTYGVHTRQSSEIQKSTKCVDSEMSIQQSHFALDPVVISSSIENAIEKVHESLNVQNKSTFVEENKLYSLNKEKSLSNQVRRDSPRKRILSTCVTNTPVDINPKTGINKKEELGTKEIRSESNEESSRGLSKTESSSSKFTNCKQNKSVLRKRKRINSANLESTTRKQVRSELKAKTIEDYFQFVHSTHLYDTDFERSAHSLKAILVNTENYPDMSSLLFAVIKYLSLSEKNVLLSFAKSEKMSVLLPQDEDCITTAFFIIESDENTHLKGLLKATVNMIQNLLISRKTINIYGLASLCRVVTEISKRKNDKLAPMTLCSNLLKSKHQFSPYLIASVVSIWMELFQVRDSLSDEEVIFRSSIAYGAKKKTDITKSDWNVSMKIISKYQNSQPVTNVQMSIKVLMDIIQINCCDESWIYGYMLTSALVIFAVHEDWNWIQENLLNQFIVPELNKFGIKTIHDKAFDLFCNLYVDLFLMNPNTNPLEEVLIKFFKKENITKDCSFIQENAALALMKFLILKNIPLPRILTRWFENNRDNPKVIAIRTLFTRKSKSGDSKQLLEEDFDINII